MKKIDITALTKIRGGEYQNRTESGFTQTPRLAGGSHLRQGLLSGEDPGPKGPFEDLWWTVGDSNPRPPACKAGALAI